MLIYFYSTLPKTNIAPENTASQKETSIPAIHFQAQAASFSGAVFFRKQCIPLQYSKITTGAEGKSCELSHDFPLGKSGKQTTQTTKNNMSGWMSRRLNFNESKNQQKLWVLHFHSFSLSSKSLENNGCLKRFNFTLNVVTRIGVKRQAIQFVYSGWFLLELVLRFAVDGRKLFYGEDRVMNHHWPKASYR